MRKSIILLAMISILVGCNDQKNETTHLNSMPNTYATGKVLELSDGTIYLTGSENQELYLYHYDENLSLINKQLLDGVERNDRLFYLNIAKGYLFGYGGIEDKLYRFKLDPSEKTLDAEVIHDRNVEPARLAYICFDSKNKIYEFSPVEVVGYFSIYTYNQNGKRRKLLHRTSNNDSFIKNNQLYISNHDGLYLDDEMIFSYDLYHLFDFGRIYDVKVHDDLIYGIGYDANSQGIVVRSTLSSGGTTLDDFIVISETNQPPINFHDDRMLIDIDDKTYLANLDGSDPRLLFDYIQNSTLMTKNYVFVLKWNELIVYDYDGVAVKLKK